MSVDENVWDETVQEMRRMRDSARLDRLVDELIQHGVASEEFQREFAAGTIQDRLIAAGCTMECREGGTIVLERPEVFPTQYREHNRTYTDRTDTPDLSQQSLVDETARRYMEQVYQQLEQEMLHGKTTPADTRSLPKKANAVWGRKRILRNRVKEIPKPKASFPWGEPIRASGPSNKGPTNGRKGRKHRDWRG